jgi:hypothetical protein
VRVDGVDFARVGHERDVRVCAFTRYVGVFFSLLAGIADVVWIVRIITRLSAPTCAEWCECERQSQRRDGSILQNSEYSHSRIKYTVRARRVTAISL